MSDCVFIEGLEVHTLVGVYPHERDAAQPLRMDLRLGHDNRPAGTSDALADTLDYAEVCAAVRDFVGARSDLLLERLGEALCTMLAERFGPRRIELRIDKPEAARALGCAHVGIQLVRDPSAGGLP